MTLEDYRIACGWSRNEMAKRADLDFNTVHKALIGESVSMRTVNKLAGAISKELGQAVRIRDIEGMNVRV